MITLDTARKRLGDARGFLHIDERESELEELETQIAAADFWDDTDVAQRDPYDPSWQWGIRGSGLDRDALQDVFPLCR